MINKKNIIIKATFIFSALFIVFVSPIKYASNILVINAQEKEAKDYTIDDLYWDDTDNKVMAGWNEAEDKTSYKIKLFKGKKGITNFITTNNSTYDFTKLIIEKGSGKYKFVVYPTKLGKNAQKESEELVIDSEQLSELKRNNKNRQTDKNERKQEFNSNYQGASKGINGGPGTSNVFKGPLYSISSNGKKGWNLYNNVWYYLEDNNTLATNTWKFIDNSWYYFDENSMMKTSWFKIKEYWYYFDNSGKLLINTTTPDGFVVNADGVWVQ